MARRLSTGERLRKGAQIAAIIAAIALAAAVASPIASEPLPIWFYAALYTITGTAFCSAAISFWLGRTVEEEIRLELHDLKAELDEREVALNRIRLQHELISTNIAAAVVISDATTKIVFCSPYTSVLTGYSTTDICAADDDFLRRLVVEEDLERYDRAQQVSSLAEDISVKYRITHRSGLLIWLETRLVPVLDEFGEHIATMSVSIDVTDMLSYQRQIEEQNRDLSDFASMISHDMKAPIFTIKGMAAALAEDHSAALGADGTTLLTYIAEATVRLERLVSSVLEYSAIATKNTDIQVVDLNETLRTVIADFSEQIKARRVNLNFDEDLPTITGNPIRVYQVFSNLIGNAIKYSSPERTPEISVRRRSVGGGALVIDITDNGLGVPAKKIHDIFRPFHRAHGNQIEGSGVGLACVKKIMDILGGSVNVVSTENRGSVFTLSFPSGAPRPREVPPELQRCFEQ